MGELTFSPIEGVALLINLPSQIQDMLLNGGYLLCFLQNTLLSPRPLAELPGCGQILLPHFGSCL